MSTTLPSAPDADDARPRQRDRDPAPLARRDAARTERKDVSSRSVEEAARLTQQFYGAGRFAITSASSTFSFRYASLGDTDLSLHLTGMNGRLAADITRLDDYVVTRFREGPGRIRVGRELIDAAAGQSVALPSASPFSLEVPPGGQSLVHASRAFVDSVATEFHGGPALPISFRGGQATSPAGAALWREAVAAATPVVTDPEAAPLTRMEAKLSVVRVWLRVFPWQTHHVPDALLVPRLSRARAAAEFLQDNAHLPITPSDAAAAAGLQTRSLQNAFQRHLGCSPTEYLREVRLDRVRRDLLEHGPKTASVADIARAWGFMHLGRFASAYQDRFHEKPNETLRRRAPEDSGE